MNVIYKQQKGLDSSILCGGPLIQERERTTITRWRVGVTFRLRLWCHRIHSLACLQLHSISPAIVLPSELFDWRRPTCFQMVHSVIGLINSITVWSLVLIWVEWTLSVVENEISYAFSTNLIPSSWCFYLTIRASQDNQRTFPHLIEPCTLHNCNSQPTPFDIRWVST